jgi:hypothetical protein
VQIDNEQLKLVSVSVHTGQMQFKKYIYSNLF